MYSIQFALVQSTGEFCHSFTNWISLNIESHDLGIILIYSEVVYYLIRRIATI